MILFSALQVYKRQRRQSKERKKNKNHSKLISPGWWGLGRAQPKKAALPLLYLISTSALSWARSSPANVPRSLQGTAKYFRSQKPVPEISSALTLHITWAALCWQHLPAGEMQSKRLAVWPLLKAKVNLLQEGDTSSVLRRTRCPTYFTVTLRMF